jgi:hypothetical protein
MPVYTLYLSTLISSPTSNNIVVLNKNNLSNVSWRVDWDSLFHGEQNKYKFCRVRFFLMGEAFTASTPATNDWNNYSGYLTVSLPSMFNASTTLGTILGLIHPIDNPITGTGNHCMFINNLSECGVDINISGLSGVQQLNVGLLSWSTAASPQYITTMQEYQLLLTFDVYN